MSLTSAGGGQVGQGGPGNAGTGGAGGAGAGATAAAGAGAAVPVDWQQRIRERLRGTQPRHEPQQWLLPGLTARESQRFSRYFPLQPIPAAVLLPIVIRTPALTVLFTQRGAALRHHAGQISFPGGRMESEDEGPAAAALREAREEIGLDPAFVSVAGFLPDHILASGFRVTPVVAFVQPGFHLHLQAGEVQETFEVPLPYLFESANHRPRRRQFGADDVEVQLCDIPYGERNIWGATAGMLQTLQRLCVP